mmetsp:Transcript_27362/g.53494  ORF Transcript_27362/g.53494 Transcript_27362/m.53494 type:complete len:770 (+) Transcript_27362:151-2460(+)
MSQELGEHLYYQICKFQPELAGKLTGMLLQLGELACAELLHNEDLLVSRLDEALQILDGGELECTHDLPRKTPPVVSKGGRKSGESQGLRVHQKDPSFVAQSCSFSAPSELQKPGCNFSAGKDQRGKCNVARTDTAGHDHPVVTASYYSASNSFLVNGVNDDGGAKHVGGRFAGQPGCMETTASGSNFDGALSQHAQAAASSLRHASAASTDDGCVPGLAAWMLELKIQHALPEARQWLAEMGACCLEEVLENMDDFMDALQLKPLERRRVINSGKGATHAISRMSTGQTGTVATSEGRLAPCSFGQASCQTMPRTIASSKAMERPSPATQNLSDVLSSHNTSDRFGHVKGATKGLGKKPDRRHDVISVVSNTMQEHGASLVPSGCPRGDKNAKGDGMMGPISVQGLAEHPRGSSIKGQGRASARTAVCSGTLVAHDDPEELMGPLLRTVDANMRISEVGLGTWSWGNRKWGFQAFDRSYDEHSIEGALQAALQAGVYFIDTAPTYGHGLAESLLGRNLPSAEVPGSVCIATKYYPHPRDSSLPAAMLSAARKSLQRLGPSIQRLGLFQVHAPVHPTATFKQYADGLAAVVHAGLTSAVGVCNFSGDELRVLHGRLAEQGIPLATLQVEFSLLRQYPAHCGLLEECRQLGVVVLAYSPLGMGRLTGKFSNSERLPWGDGERPFGNTLGPERLAELQMALKQLGRRHRKSPSQVALNWVICKGAVPIPGAKTAQQACENCGAMGWRLSSDECAWLADFGAVGSTSDFQHG